MLQRILKTCISFLFLYVFCGLYLPKALLSQGISHQDSLTTTTMDTLSPAGKAMDSTAAEKKKSESELNSPVDYTADRISFSIDRRRTYLEKNVTIDFQNMKLEAGKVVIDWQNNNLVATGIADSTDSLGNPVYTSLPVFTEKGNKPITGTQLEYNFETRRGKVLDGKTEMEPGYYKGEEIEKIGKNTLLVKDGYFTSCDSIDHPDYYFKAQKMRILLKKRAVAEPIVMYIADVPVFAVPFGVFPMERGRRSGLIVPTYGSSSYGGNYLRNFGFYWAASQYWDATLLATFYERTGVTYDGELRYNKRYQFDGYVKGLFAPKDVTTGQKISRWNLQFAHRQTIGQTLTINAQGTFQSDKSFLRDYSNNLQDRLNQILSTNVAISKSWPGSKNSLSLGINRTEYLQTGNLSYTLPQVSFSHTQSNIFPYNPQGESRRHWYNDIYYSYRSNAKITGSKTLQQSNTQQPDTVATTFLRNTKKGWTHSANLSFNSKILKYFKYNQSASVDELWVPDYYEYTWVDSSRKADKRTVHGFRARHTFSTSIGTSTTLYGLYELPFSAMKVIRHKMDPSISFTYTPDFSSSEFGYYQELRDSTGNIVAREDRFANNPYGGTPRGKSMRMNISVNNLFQGKIIREGEEKKVDLFSLTSTSSYNFAADSLKWNPINTTLRAKASQNLSFNLSTIHSLYKIGPSGFGNRNEYVWENGFSLPRLLQVRLNAQVHLAPPKKKAKEKTEEAPEEGEEPENPDEEPEEPVDNMYSNPMDNLSKFKLPWDVTMDFAYSVNRNSITNINKIFTSSISARLELTPKWRIQYSASVDLINKTLTYQSFDIYRDLHCWEMSFQWSPSPVFSYFSLRIQIKSSLLKDIKLTKSSAGSRPY